MRYSASLSTQPLLARSRDAMAGEYIAGEYIAHSSGKRIFTDAVMREAIATQYPELNVTAIPVFQSSVSVSFLQYAALGFASATPIDESSTCPLKWRLIVSPARRTDPTLLADEIQFGKYLYKWNNHEFILYVVDCRDGVETFSAQTIQYLIGPASEIADGLLTAASGYFSQLHDEVWVFDGGYWDKSSELYEAVEKASWDDVILEADMKKSVQNDISRFFQSKEKYDDLKVPWKRGVIFHGPPGNGKTISIKAIMHVTSHWKEPVPSLYVRSFTNVFGPEASIKDIFQFARRKAPCLLLFEDLDSLVTDDLRSYFLNEVDGISQSLGVLMIGSTNHLDQLDPGLAKRPSRFDRKFAFPKPNLEQRVAYCEFWRNKLKSNKDIGFPHALSKAIAEITDDFSFAYMQEAFVASLLAIAAEDDNATCSARKGDSDLDDLVLWKEMQKQIKILRDEM